MAEDVKTRIQSLINSHKVLIFMKGTRLFPMCGFSAATVGVFNELGAPFETVDVLEDDELREGVKVFSNWPTIPQVYVAGKFIGGCDIIKEMYARGELEPLVKSAATA